MLYMIQIIKMLNNKEIKLFIDLFKDLDDTIEELKGSGINERTKYDTTKII